MLKKTLLLILAFSLASPGAKAANLLITENKSETSETNC